MYKLQYRTNNTTICFPEKTDGTPPLVFEVGYSTPPHGYTPKALRRDVFVIHYVISGRGRYYGERVEGPCMFLETPDRPHVYSVDDDDGAPQWEQYWIMFGKEGMAERLSEAGFSMHPASFPCPYIHHVRRIFRDLQTPANYINQDDHFYMMAGLFQLLSLNAASTGQTDERHYTPYVRTICDYIHEHYATVSCEAELAELVHLSKRYMHKLFKRELGTSPIRYLSDYRIHCAKNLLTDQGLSIQAVSEAVGFSDPAYFCRVFQKNCNGLSPSEYRKKSLLRE
ncbi:MAG: helix-turn-helix domain-containing protein [Clostridia bacterium]|nr:helix-turn-helix domain-containing protein [Clostridia bacterium]